MSEGTSMRCTGERRRHGRHVTYWLTGIMERALELEKKGVMGMDALQVACAEEAKADYFVSCDDVLITRLGRVEDLKVHAVGLLELISREVF